MEEKTDVCIEEFGRLADSKDYVSLIRNWQHLTFHAAFVKTAAGNDIPALRDVQGRGAFIAGPDRKAVESELEGLVVLAGDGDIFIKPVPLKELARNAARLKAWIVWGGPDGGVIVDSILHALGLSAIVKDLSGTEYLYRAKVFELETVDASEADQIGPVTAQTWTISPIVEGREGEVYDKRLIYDDESVRLFQPGADPLDTPEARSDLTLEEQALFDRWQQPVYPFHSLEGENAPGARGGQARAGSSSQPAPTSRVGDRKAGGPHPFEKFVVPMLAITLVSLLVMAFM